MCSFFLQLFFGLLADRFGLCAGPVLHCYCLFAAKFGALIDHYVLGPIGCDPAFVGKA